MCCRSTRGKEGQAKQVAEENEQRLWTLWGVEAKGKEKIKARAVRENHSNLVACVVLVPEGLSQVLPSSEFPLPAAGMTESGI